MNAGNDKHIFVCMRHLLFHVLLHQCLFKILKKDVFPAGKHEDEDHNTKEKSVETKLEMDTTIKTDHPLPPYDPSKPVGRMIISVI